MMKRLAEAICNYAGNDPECRLRAQAAARALDIVQVGVRLERARDAAVRMRIFTTDQFASELNIAHDEAAGLLERLACVHEERTPRGRLWLYLKPEAEHVERRRHVPEWEHAMRVNVERGTVMGVTSRGRRVGGNAAWNRLLDDVRRAGGTIDKVANGHVRVTGPGGSLQVAGTPRGSSFDKYKKRIRDKAGISV
jgi:hypothetical protein